MTISIQPICKVRYQHTINDKFFETIVKVKAMLIPNFHSAMAQQPSTNIHIAALGSKRTKDKYKHQIMNENNRTSVSSVLDWGSSPG